MTSLYRSVLLLWMSAASVQAASAVAVWGGNDFQGRPCEGKPVGYGPYDYLQRGSFSKNLDIVERFHFTPEVENLVSGESSYVEDDLDYTLRAWPNHHRALNSMMRFQARLDAAGERRLRSRSIPPVECYLQRAIAYSPGDATARLLLGILLQRKGALDEARKVYEGAIAIAPNDLQLQYNYGLLLVEAGDLKQAREVADLVYQQGFPLPGLKRKLSAASP